MKIIVFTFLLFAFTACTQKEVNEQVAMTPWGTVVESEKDTTAHYSIQEILQSGELRALTISGADTYFTFDRAQLGVHYLLCEQLAQLLGVELKVEECTDTLEMVEKLRDGDGDLIILPLSKSVSAADSLVFCGPGDETAQWAVMEYNKQLADSIDSWYRPELMAETQERQTKIMTTGGAVQCHVYEPVLDRGKGVISQWDHLFKTYSEEASTDWRLLAAICYQESCFDPQARSWAGACGLMQLMPSTAESFGLTADHIFDPEANVETAAKVINQLTMLYRDVPDDGERMSFVLASYNGGHGHVRDAMALAEKYGDDPYVWDSVSEYILLLSQPKYYRDAVVKCGYMRGTETHDYVDRVRERYEEYSGVALGTATYGVTKSGGYSGVNTEPTRREGKTNKYQI